MKGYSELKRLAENATPGEWSHEQDNLYFYEDGYTRHMMELSEGSDIGYVEQKHNSDFIATANPKVILELIAEVESLKKDAARYRWLRQHDFDIGSYHPEGDFSHESWFERFDDQSIDRMIAEEIAFEEEAIIEANNK